MKRAEQLAWAALAGLVTIAIILMAGGILYHFTGFWAGMMLACGQAVVVALTAWGLVLARQAQELAQSPMIRGISSPGAAAPKSEAGSPFRMSMGDDTPTAPVDAKAAEAGTLDTGFQRLVISLAALTLIVLGSVTGYLVFRAYHWAGANPDIKLPIIGTFETPTDLGLDELGLVIGLAAAGLYITLWWLTRASRDASGYGEAVRGTFTLGIAGMIALAAATVLGYFRVAYASELASGLLAALMLLQGLELLMNALRSYSGIEELDQEAVDLQALPLVPMLGSVWLSGLRILFAQSVGLSGKERESSVVARLMPRVLASIVVIAIGISCIRVVPPGEVAVLERLGQAQWDESTHKLLPSSILYPGMHLTLPWPIDQLVLIPTENLQLTDVGTELHAPKELKNVDFQFWTIRNTNQAEDNEDEFITGGPGSPQLLETYVQVRWRVSDPLSFYSSLSHSDFFEKSATTTRTLPIYEAMIQRCTTFAVTQAFAIHSLDQIMITARGEVEKHCGNILQDKLNSLHSGIEVVSLTIKDLHPPYGRNDMDDPREPPIGGVQRLRGPASAFEFVVSMRENKQRMILEAQAEKVSTVNLARGEAAKALAEARAAKSRKIAQAQGEAQRLITMTKGIDSADRAFQMELLGWQLKARSLNDAFDPISKIVVDPSVDVQIYQGTDKSNVLRPLNP